MLATLMFLRCSTAFAQEAREITGSVLDAQSKEAIPGTNILIKGTLTGTSTDKDGAFRLSARPEDILVFSFVGYETYEEAVGNRSTLQVSLKPGDANLNEVVVVGYGSVRKTDLTGSVGQVRVDELVKAPVTSFSDALAGRVAGVQVSANDGQPGSAPNIIIRGANSLTQNNSPLYVIDGFPVENPNAAAINPEEIESMNILKDASATAIYGSRAANGVIVIETKRGKSGRPVVTLNTSYGFQEVRKTIDMMNPYEFIKYQYERRPEITAERYFTEGRTLETYRNEPAVDWQDQVLRRGGMTINNLAIRGGTDKTQYSLSGSVVDQQGVVINTNYGRYQGRFTLDQTINDKVKTGVTVNYSKLNTFGQPVASNPGSSSISTYLWFRVWAYRPLSGSEFDLVDEIADPANITASDVRLNPLVTVQNDYTKDVSTDFSANGYLSYAITDALTLRLTGITNSRINRADRYYNSNTPQGSPLNPNNVRGVNGSVSYGEINVWSSENTLTYHKELNAQNTLNVVGGFSLQSTKTEGYGFAAQNLPNEGLIMNGLDEGVPYSGTAYSSANTLASFFGRANFNHQSKYLLTVTFRGDGSSKFAPQNRWGYFPSAAVAWNMSNEDFLKSSTLISNSKLRFSYGVTGNNRVGDFDWTERLSQTINGYSYNNGTPTSAINPANMANQNLRWEKTAQMDLGYDLGLFRNRVELTVDLYQKITNDLLLRADLPTSSGFSSAFKNIGKLKNEGIELSLFTVNMAKKDFSWRSNFNISFNKNQILELTEGQQLLQNSVSFESQFSAPLYVSAIGQPAGMFYGYVFDGVYQYEDFLNPAPGVYVLRNELPTNGNARTAIQPGDIKYQDTNGDGVVNSLDMIVIGRGQPIHTGGFSNSFTYKGFSLDAFFQWSYGNQIYNANRLTFEGNSNGRHEMNQFASYVNRWSPENQTNANYRAGGQGPIGYHSSRVLEDGSYLRLKTLALSYSIPQRIVSKLSIANLSLTMSAQNLLTWTRYSGMDPEVSARNSVLTPGFDFSAYPQARTVLFGLNATF
ncbi:TonB-linked SusC/RagA family outer membrane protein [Rhabdobacter roseus]|uniref:TonB-linked SusC/RagA family outer membrane protein n=1 Tax=Rhabdobacter roseus TaxID=1655419 RepID=A0A840TWE5_9BACT|nr:TonB-dependent receptor [Rhabdobacter roseus]MBB5284270.1 TonB-linked SusC/RagA family outer membrane protein [Rhabdobacter roseus]